MRSRNSSATYNSSTELKLTLVFSSQIRIKVTVKALTRGGVGVIWDRWTTNSICCIFGALSPSNMLNYKYPPDLRKQRVQRLSTHKTQQYFLDHIFIVRSYNPEHFLNFTKRSLVQYEGSLKVVENFPLGDFTTQISYFICLDVIFSFLWKLGK